MKAPPVRLRARPERRFVYSGRSLLVTDVAGVVTGQGEEGYYFRNTRLLSRLELSCDGHPIRPFAFSPVGRNCALGFAEIRQSQEMMRREIEQEVSAVHARLGYFLGNGLRLQIHVSSYSGEQVTLPLRVTLAGDFRGTAEASAGIQKVKSEVAEVWDGERGELTLRTLHPDLDRAVVVRLEHAPSPRWGGEAIEFELRIPPRGEAEVQLVAEPRFEGRVSTAPPATFRPDTEIARTRRRLFGESTRLETSNTTVARAWETAVGDLASLPLGLPEGPAAPIAGVPLYQQLFGRDMLTTGWQALAASPELLRDALLVVAATQGSRIDDWSDEEPGKMLHQAGDAPPSALGLDPFLSYYGDYATPVDFLAMLGQYYLWTGDLHTIRRLLPAARSAIQWLERYGDIDGDGLLEYVTRSEKGVKNQGWKDAANAVVDERGENVPNPIATCELQAYWYAGLRNVAPAFAAAGDRIFALDLLRRARSLRREVERRFWMEDETTYALALGREKQQIRSVASNAGHLLVTGIASPSRGRRVAERLLAGDMFSGWGIRTLSDRHPAYNPFSYHLGSVWPVEQATIAAGFGRYRAIPQLHTLARSFFDSTELFSENRLPESIGGMTRSGELPHPGVYPRSNSPQAWSSSAVVLMVQALLGLRPLAPLQTVTVDPELPDWLPDLSLTGLRVGSAIADLRFYRDRRGHTRFRSELKKGSLRFVRQPGMRDPDTSLLRRLRLLMRG